MNVETLAFALQFLTDLDRSLGVQSKLQAVLSSLENLVQSPAHPQHQATLASALSAFDAAVAALTERISPAVRALIKELEGEKFFDSGMAADVKQAVVTNAMTPAVARDFVRNLSGEREAYLEVLNSTNQGIRKLGIKGKELPAGSAEMAFLIPRGIFGNELGTFAKELGFLNRLIMHVSEILAAHAEPIQLGQISSSDPTITLATGLAAMTFIGAAVSKFLEAWKKVEEIREIRQRLNKIGMRSKTTLTELTDEITSTVNEVVEESTTEILASGQVQEARKNELGGLIRKDLLRLFGQVEQGLVVEIRVSPASKTDGDADPNLETLKVLSETLQFPVMTNEPILLSSGDLLDDDDDAVMVRHRKKTTTTKHIATQKKTSGKSTEDQPDEE